MKKLFFRFLSVICLMLFFVSQVSAAKVFLRNGMTIEGDIVEQAEGQVDLNVEGMTQSYYLEEVDRIENDEQEVIFPEKEEELFEPSSESKKEFESKKLTDAEDKEEELE